MSAVPDRRIHVAFTPDEAIPAPLAVVVDVLRATSTIAQALASGYGRVYCCRDVDDARALRETLGTGLLGGERQAVRIPGFDVGASPREFLDGGGETLIFSTTNGTRAVLAAAEASETVLLGSLLNLGAVAATAGAADGDICIVCAGFQGQFALDDAYCAGRIVALLGGRRTDAALACELLARSFSSALEGLEARTYGPPGLEDDIAWCAREDSLDVVPRLTGMLDGAGEIRA